MSSTDCNDSRHDAFSVRQAPLERLGHWVHQGWNDMIHAGWPSYLHGVIVFVLSLFTMSVALTDVHLLPGVATAFVLVGPILATGLYALSRRLETEEKPTLRDVLNAWRTASRCLWRFSVVLIAVGAAWVFVSALLFDLFVKEEINDLPGFLQYVLTQDTDQFILWSLAGGLVAGLTFAMTVVAVPLLLDRDVTTRIAVRASIRAVGENPGVMTFWALFIGLLTAFSMVTAMVGFIVLYPLMGHASWRLYRDIIEADGAAAPERSARP